MEEKKDRVKDFLDDAIDYLKNDPLNNFYINSLRGYYIHDAYSYVDYNSSAIPYPATGFASTAGRHGDVPSYTQDINGVINDYILGKDTAQRGPLGIMLMNFTGIGYGYVNMSMDMHGDDLLQTIIDNNFRFLLNTSRAE